MSTEEELRVYPRHLRACGYCLIPGGRDLALHLGLDWRDFIRNGIAVSELEGINDAMVQNVIATARNEQVKSISEDNSGDSNGR